MRYRKLERQLQPAKNELMMKHRSRKQDMADHSDFSLQGNEPLVNRVMRPCCSGRYKTDGAPEIKDTENDANHN